MTCIVGREHDWDPEMFSVEIDEYIYLSQPCNNVEITGSYTCDRLDETFYEEGAECDAARRVVFDYTVHEHTMHGTVEIDIGRMYNEHQTLYDKLMDRLEQHLIEAVCHYGADVTADRTIEFHLHGAEYTVELSVTDVDILPH